jgi:hypothetical protein
MFHNGEQQGTERDSDLQSEVEKQDAPSARNRRPRRTLALTDGYADLPTIISSGVIYVQVPLGFFLQTGRESLSELLRYLEAGVPKARRAALPLASNGSASPSEGVALKSVVRNSRKRGPKA